MNALLGWIDRRTGAVGMIGSWLRRPMPGGPAWRFVWPSTIFFTYVTQLITGLALWMYYSPGAQSAWESVYFLQYRVQGGWLLRAMHYQTGQAMLVLVGIYFLQIVIRGSYRAPREFQFWGVVLIGLVTLMLNMTGDLLAYDQNALWATRVRTGYLFLVPSLGPSLFKLAAGGAELGHLTLTRFLSLHIGIFAVALGVLLAIHAKLAWRHGLEGAAIEPTADSASATPSSAYWPGQGLRDMIACVVVLAVIVGLAAQHGISGPAAGIELGAPANPTEDPGTARPEWSFRGLYQLHEMFPSSQAILPIFVLPGAVTLIFFSMPLLGRTRVGHAFNVLFVVGVFGGMGFLAIQSYRNDAKSEPYAAALIAQREQSDRARILAGSPGGIPPSGALSLLQSDPKTQGPRIFQQRCAGCHDFSNFAGAAHAQEHPTASDLHGYGSREWLRGFLTVDGISSAKYFGNTKFKHGGMYDYLKDSQSDVDPKDVERTVLALSAEAGLKSQQDADSKDADEVAKGKQRITTDCTDCHTFHGKGTANGPDLTGYASRAWLIAFIGNPSHTRFYGKSNDRMPAYFESDTAPDKNLMTANELQLLVDWLRGDWYEGN